MPGPQHPFDQSAYQVRFEWGAAGLARLAASDVIVIVDVLSFSTTVIRALEQQDELPMDAGSHAASIDGVTVLDTAADALSINDSAVFEAAARTPALVLVGALRNAAAVAAAVLTEQTRRAERTSIAIIACGELTGAESRATLRFTMEDQLGAGAIIDALGALGIDHTSPEAAATGESFRSLRRASTHLLTASGSGRELIGRGLRDDVEQAASVDAASVVPVLRDGVFRAF